MFCAFRRRPRGTCGIFVVVLHCLADSDDFGEWSLPIFGIPKLLFCCFPPKRGRWYIVGHRTITATFMWVLEFALPATAAIALAIAVVVLLAD